MNQWEAFGRWCLEELRDNIGDDLDGGAAQDKAEELCLLVRVNVTEPCGDNCFCAEYDDFPQECLRVNADINSTMGTSPEIADK